MSPKMWYYFIGKLIGMEVNGIALKQLREAKALSMRELGQLSGVHHNVIWRLENGVSGAQGKTIRKLADALDVKPHELIR